MQITQQIGVVMKIQNLAQIKANNGKVFDFKDVIESVDGHIVKEFTNKALLKKLKLAAKNTMNVNNSLPRPYKGGINEFGNFVQVLFAQECQKLGLKYSTPVDTKGRAKESGYPDGCISFKKDYFCYIEVKTYSEKNKNSSLRSFFYSPSNTSKITRDAAHLLVGFSTKSASADGPHTLLDFHFTDMFSKKVKLKLEFNQNNKEIYKKSELL